MPANIFAAADAKSSAAVDRLYGERLRFLPRRTGKFTIAESADPDRSMRDFIGTLSGALGQQNLSGDRSGNFEMNVTTRDRTVTCQPDQLPAEVRGGDLIQALDQPGQPTYQIVEEPIADGSGNRYIIPLVTV